MSMLGIALPSLVYAGLLTGAWKKWAKYHRRSAVESATHRWKWVTGERALSRTLTRLKVEGVLRAKFLNSLIASSAS